VQVARVKRYICNIKYFPYMLSISGTFLVIPSLYRSKSFSLQNTQLLKAFFRNIGMSFLHVETTSLPFLQPGVTRELLAGTGFTATDIALCSSDEARSFLPSEMALSLAVLPLALSRGAGNLILHVASASDSAELIRKLTFTCGMDIAVTLVPIEILKEAIPKAYFGSDVRLRQYIDRLAAKKQPASLKKEPKIPSAKGDVASFLTAILEFAAVRRASDLHLAPGESGVVIKMRVDGELLVLDGAPYEASFHEQVVSRLKVLANLDIAQRKTPQDGAFSFNIGDHTQSIRVSTLPSVHGESVVVRFLHARKIPEVSELGLEPLALRALRSALDRTEGLILLTGPTGSGKTTTMYSAVTALEQRGRNVVTVEDPVEAQLPGTIQVQVCVEQGLDYPRAIRSVLRHDPDVLLIGEMRDGVSASMGLDAASTGHLTLSSLHVGSCLHVLTRLEALGVSRARAIPAIALVVNQRLLPKLCVRCKQRDEKAPGVLGSQVYRSAGCESCGMSGYSGRVLVTELLNVQSQRAKDACYRAAHANDLLATLPVEAYIPWTDSLQYNLTQGDISLKQVEEFVVSEMN
jgi:type II secretory ATPase GspE/PulE/Tfp pilus assembly ATPase PilB-like protein